MGSARQTTIPNGFYLKDYKTKHFTADESFETYSIEESFIMPAKNISIEYNYYPNSYSITYNYEGTNNPSNPSTYNVLYGVTLANPMKPGYTFKNWTIDGTVITGINPGANATFTSSSDLYTKLNSRTIGDKIIVAN